MQRILIIAAVLLGMLGSSGWGQVFESLYTFPASGAEGAHPEASLMMGPDGKIYGTTTEGGSFESGTVFRFSTNGSEIETFAHFNPATTGLSPSSPLLNIGDGYLYGVTLRNQIPNGPSKAGTLYRLDPTAPASADPERGLTPVFQIPGTGDSSPMRARAIVMAEPNVLHVLCDSYAGIWRVPLDNTINSTVAYFFQHPSIDGSFPTKFTLGWDGYFYGTTQGSSVGASGPNVRGTIFRIAPDGTGMTRLHESELPTGTSPRGGIHQGPDGHFYGTMCHGGTGKGVAGTLYRITSDGDFTILHHFRDLGDPRSDLLFASDGYIYGTTHGGGSTGYGGVFRIRPNGTGYKVLHSFNGSNGAYPTGGLVQAPDGNLYGTTRGAAGTPNGTIFRLKMKLPAPPENRAPIAFGDFATTAGAPVLIDVRANDFDPDGDGLLVGIDIPPSHGTATLQPGGKILYTPDGSYTGEDQFTYTVSDGRGGQAWATVLIRNIASTPLMQPGTYSGLVMLDPDLSFASTIPRGQFSLKVTNNGSFTGTLFTQKKRVKLKGSFNSNGTAAVNVKLPRYGAATLFLAFQKGDPNPIHAVLYGSESWSGVAYPSRSSDAPGKKSYTIQIGRIEDKVAGTGYGVMTIQPNGSVKVAGKLGDGTTLSWGTTLITFSAGSKGMTVYSEPLSQGVCGGFILASDEDSYDFLGTLRWIRPPAKTLNKPYAMGFNEITYLAAYPFTPPPAKAPVLEIADAAVYLYDASLPGGVVSGDFTLEGEKVRVTSPLRSLSFNRKNGLFSGKIQVDKKTISFKGAVNQRTGFGFGHFISSGVTGAVDLHRPLPAIVHTSTP